MKRCVLLLQVIALSTGPAATAGATNEGPCDILAAAGNPCVAAHSTTRALFGTYAGALYNVSRPDGSVLSVGVKAPGGFADISEQDKFCAKGDCVISFVIDQSNCGGKCPPGRGNNLGQRHRLVNASQHKITVGAEHTPVYGMWFDPGYGYHVDNTTGIATGNDPESIYAVMSGTHYNGGCCFDCNSVQASVSPSPPLALSRANSLACFLPPSLAPYLLPSLPPPLADSFLSLTV